MIAGQNSREVQTAGRQEGLMTDENLTGKRGATEETMIGLIGFYLLLVCFR